MTEAYKPGFITYNDIQWIRRQYKIGDMVRIITYKAQESDSTSRLGVIRKARIVDKYRYFAVVELAGGVRDSVLWIDLRRTSN